MSIKSSWLLCKGGFGAGHGGKNFGAGHGGKTGVTCSTVLDRTRVVGD
jgi:hypothetical protein